MFIYVQSSPTLPLGLVFLLPCSLRSLKVGSEVNHGLTAYTHKQMESKRNRNRYTHIYTHTRQ